jgi:hypothetical protein
MAQVLEQEAETYERHREELLAKHEDKFVLIHGDQILGIYETERDAIHAGRRQLGHVPMLVKQIERVETLITFGGGLLGPDR